MAEIIAVSPADPDAKFEAENLVWPNTTLCCINPDDGPGTGFMVGKFCLITAGHVVERYIENPKKVTVYFGWNGDSSILHSKAQDIKLHPDYYITKRDIAVVIIEQEIGDRTGTIGCKLIDENNIIGFNLGMRGFPFGGKKRNTQATIENYSDSFFTHVGSKTDQGFSGAAITDPFVPYISFGVHIKRKDEKDNAVRFTETDIGWIQTILVQ